MVSSLIGDQALGITRCGSWFYPLCHSSFSLNGNPNLQLINFLRLFSAYKNLGIQRPFVIVVVVLFFFKSKLMVFLLIQFSENQWEPPMNFIVVHAIRKKTTPTNCFMINPRPLWASGEAAKDS